MTRRRPVRRYPLRIEQAYARRLLRRLRAMQTLILERVPGLEGRADVDAVSWAVAGWFRSAVDAVRTAFRVTMPVEESSLSTTAAAVDGWATTQTMREVQTVVGVDLTGDARIAASKARSQSTLVQWARENVSLITSMEEATFDDLAQAVADATIEGRTDLAKVIRERFGVADGRARLIARDQVAKLNGRITQERQTAMGVKSYEWSSSGDERVRPSHRALDGKVRKWSNPHPTEGHPGSAIACRCVAIAVVDDVEEVEPDPTPAATSTKAPTQWGGQYRSRAAAEREAAKYFDAGSKWSVVEKTPGRFVVMA